MQPQTQNPDLTPAKEPGFWRLATNRLVVKRATRIALVVGSVLAVINHGDQLMLGNFSFNTALKILLTYCVPYSVSTYSSVLAIRENSKTQRKIP